MRIGKSAIVFALFMAVLVLGHVAPHKHWMDTHEANNLTGAWLVSQGTLPYRDFFSHHPPFAYWFAAPVIAIFGGSVPTIRLAILLYYILALAVLYRANRRCSRPFSFGLFILFATLGHVRYLGQLYLADHLFAWAILVVFMQFWQWDERRPLRWGDWLVVGLATFAALSSTLVASYPLALLAIGLAVKQLRFSGGRRRVVGAIGIAAVVAVPFVAAALWLWATNSLRAFSEQVIGFSVAYYRTDTGFASWTPSFSPLAFFLVNVGRCALFFAEALLLRQGGLECALAWSNVGVVVALVGRRQVALGTFYLLYVLMLMLRMDAFHESPYMIQSLWAAAWLLQPLGRKAAEVWRSFRTDGSIEAAGHGDVLRAAGAALLLALLGQTYVEGIMAERPGKTPEMQVARLCAQLTSPGETLIALPTSPEIYVMADRKPAIFSYSYYSWQDRSPWLLNRMVRAIESQKAPLLVVNWWAPPIGSFSFSSYAEEVRDAIRNNYQPLSISAPQIYARNASFYELERRFERIRRRAVIEVPKSDLLPLTVSGPDQVTQHFTPQERISSATLEVLLSATRRSDTWAEIAFGAVGSDGKERVLLRKQFRTAQVRHYPIFTTKGHWYEVDLEQAGDLQTGQRYFFRIRSEATPALESLQVMAGPRGENPAVGQTLYGSALIGRSVCFRLSGVTVPKLLGTYPIVEQSLGRKTLPAGELRQTVSMPEATTVSAVALLTDSPATTLTEPLCAVELLSEAGRHLATLPLQPTPGERQWTTLAFAPAFLSGGEKLIVIVRAAADQSSPPLRLWTAGSDLYAGGDLSVAGQVIGDDLCFKLYPTAPRTAGRPDIAVTALELDPSAPTTVTPSGLMRLTVRLENRGTSPTGRFWLEFFGSPKDVSGPTEFVADSVRVENLKPGEVWQQTVGRSLYPLKDGLYTLTVVADRLGEVIEANEENNRVRLGEKDLLVVSHATDVNLFVQDFWFHLEELRRGRTIEFEGFVSNSGKQKSGRFEIEFWAAREPDVAGQRLRIADPIVIESLGPSEIIDLNRYLRTLRAEMPSGILHIGCTVDARNEVLETQEWDNAGVVGPVVVEP